jgi:hypothetical protein
MDTKIIEGEIIGNIYKDNSEVKNNGIRDRSKDDSTIS